MGKQEPIAVRSKPPGSPTSSMSADQASSSPLLPLNSGEFSRGDLNHQGDASTSGSSLGSGSKPADAWAKQNTKESASAPFVPFSGGGQRLGGPSGSLRPLTSSAKSPKSFSGPGGPSKPKKSKPGEELQQEPEPVRSRLSPRAFSRPKLNAGHSGYGGHRFAGISWEQGYSVWASHLSVWSCEPAYISTSMFVPPRRFQRATENSSNPPSACLGDLDKAKVALSVGCPRPGIFPGIFLLLGSRFEA